MGPDAALLRKILAGKQKQTRHPFIQCLFSENRKYIFKKNSAEKNTIFRLFSLTEIVTAVAVMQLVEQNKLKLYDKLSGFFPEFGKPGIFESEKESEKEITIHHLLTHTAGIGHIDSGSRLSALYSDSGLFENNKSSLEIVKKLADFPLEFSPGSRWQYSLSYLILGALIENISEKTLDNFFYEYIFAPLEMKDTGFYIHPSAGNRTAEMFTADNSGNTVIYKGHKAEWLKNITKPGLLRGDIGLVSTLDEFSRIVQMLLNFGTYKTWRIVTKEFVDIIMQNQLSPECTPIGPGFPMHISVPCQWGYGFGGAVKTDESENPFSTGSFVCSGIAGSFFWIDRHKKTAGIIMQNIMKEDNSVIRSFTESVYENL